MIIPWKEAGSQDGNERVGGIRIPRLSMPGLFSGRDTPGGDHAPEESASLLPVLRIVLGEGNHKGAVISPDAAGMIGNAEIPGRDGTRALTIRIKI